MRRLRPEGLGGFFETIPDDGFGLFVGRGDVPDDLIGNERGANDIGKRQFGFTKAAAGGEDAKTRVGLEDFPLMGVEKFVECFRVHVWVSGLRFGLKRSLGSPS